MKRGVLAVLLVGATLPGGVVAGGPSQTVAARAMKEGDWSAAVSELEALLRTALPFTKLQEVKGLLDEARWREAEALGTVEAVEGYLEAQGPAATFKADADHLACVLRERRAYETAGSDGVEPLAAFATAHQGCPGSRKAWTDAADRAAREARFHGSPIGMLEVASRFDDTPMASALRQEGLDGLFRMLPTMPLDEAGTWLELYRGTPREGDAYRIVEDRAWQEASRVGTRESLEAFLDRFEEGRHAGEAETERRQLLRGIFVMRGERLVEADAWPGPESLVHVASPGGVASVELHPLRKTPEGLAPAWRFLNDEVALLRALGWPGDLLTPLRPALGSADGVVRSFTASLAGLEVGGVRLVARDGRGTVVVDRVLSVTAPAAMGLEHALRAAVSRPDQRAAVAGTLGALLGRELTPAVPGPCRETGVWAVYTGDPKAAPGTVDAPFSSVGAPGPGCVGLPMTLHAGRTPVGSVTIAGRHGSRWQGSVAIRSGVSPSTVMESWLWAAHGALAPIELVRAERAAGRADELIACCGDDFLAAVRAKAGPTGAGAVWHIVDLDGSGRPEVVGLTAQHTLVGRQVGSGWEVQALPGALQGLFSDARTGTESTFVLVSRVGESSTLAVYVWRDGRAELLGAAQG